MEPVRDGWMDVCMDGTCIRNLALEFLSFLSLFVRVYAHDTVQFVVGIVLTGFADGRSASTNVDLGVVFFFR